MSHVDYASISGEHGPHAYYPELSVSIDDEGDVWLSNEEGALLLSLNQAFTLHFQLGQLLTANARNTYGRHTYQSLLYASQELTKHG